MTFLINCNLGSEHFTAQSQGLEVCHNLLLADELGKCAVHTILLGNSGQWAGI